MAAVARSAEVAASFPRLTPSGWQPVEPQYPWASFHLLLAFKAKYEPTASPAIPTAPTIQLAVGTLANADGLRLAAGDTGADADVLATTEAAVLGEDLGVRAGISTTRSLS